MTIVEVCQFNFHMRVTIPPCTTSITSIISSKQLIIIQFSYLYTCTCIIENTRKTLAFENQKQSTKLLAVSISQCIVLY